MPVTPKSRLGKYELLEEIGDGAEGRIFKAQCVEAGVNGVAIGEFVALKRLRQTSNETQSDIFKRTTRILRNLDHPNIVRYKDSFEGIDESLDEPVYCLVTELLEGQTLKDLLDKNKNGLEWDYARRILLQTLEALEYAAGRTVVHRDLKPSNIYLTHQGEVKIIDFGIAKHEDSGATSSSGGLLGSWDYMACDFVLMSQESNFRGDQQSDIYSFGVCLYQLLTGALPYPPLGGNAQIAYFQRYMALDKLPRIKYTHPIFSILRGARTCLEKCLTTDRSFRYKAFTELLTAVKQLSRRTLQHDEDLYEYLDYIGKGGFGKVYKARRTRDGLEVAIKEVLADRNASRFVREAKMLKVTQHQHLVQYLDFVEVTEKGMGDERRLFLVLEYLEGMPQAGLSYRIKTSPNGIDPVEVLRVFAAFLDCLEYLHQNTIIHRDIKPGNLYAPAGAPEKARIFDLGIAHDTDGTKTHGQVPGTLDYMPAEFATQGGERGSAQSDLYSIGVTLFQALTGKLPYERLPDDEKMAWTQWYLRCEKPPEISYTHAIFTTHPELEKLVRSSVAHRPQDRFASCKAMRLEILGILEHWDSAGKKENYEKALAETRAAFEKLDFAEAATKVRHALELWPEGAEARELLDKIENAKMRRTQYDTAIATAKRELDRGAADAAARHIRIAMGIWPEGTEAKILLESIESKRQGRTQYEAAIAAAKRELEKGDLDAATRQARLALQAWSEGLEAKQLLEKIEAERDRLKKYDAALVSAREFLAKGELDDASSKAQSALDMWPEKAEARQLLDQIETERLRRIQYDTALLSAKQVLEQDDFDAATRHARLALEIWPEGTEAKELLDRIETDRQRKLQYDSAMSTAKKELERENIDTAVEKVQLALQVWPEQEEAKQLLERLEAERVRRGKYDAAITAARETTEKGDLDEALKKIQLALQIWPEKVEAKRLLDRVETEKRRKQKYDAAIAAAKEALDQSDYETALSKVEEALRIRPMDPPAMQLRAQAEKGIRELEEDEPITVATMLEPPSPVAEPKTAATVESPPVAPPKEAAEILVDEPPTIGTVLEPPPLVKPAAKPVAPEPPVEKPKPEVKPKPEPAKEPAPKPQPAPVAAPPPPPVAPPAPPTAPAPAPKPASEPERPRRPEPPAKPEPVAPPEKPKKSKAIIFVPVGVVVVAAIAFVFLRPHGGEKAQPQPPPVSTPQQQQPAAPQQPVAEKPHPQQPGIGGLVVQSDPTGAEVWAGNQDEGKTPLALNLPPGTVTVTLRSAGLPDKAVNLTVEAGKTNEVPIKFAYGDVDLRSEPSGAAISSNGKLLANTPYHNRWQPGQYNLTLTAAGRQPTNVSIVVVDHQPLQASFILQKEKGMLRFTGNVSGISLSIDGANLGALPSSPIPVDADVEHAIEAHYKNLKFAYNTRVAAGRVQDIPISFRVEAASRFTNAIGMTFAWFANLPGCAGSQWAEGRADGGWVGQFEVTQAEFTQVMNENPSKNNAGGRYPVENMSYEQAASFCDKLTSLDSRSIPAAWHYALPSEDQWQFFAAGTPLDQQHAYYAPPGVKKQTRPEEVGLLQPASGLYDVRGNVAELTSTRWHYSSDPDAMRFYICRGGAFDSRGESAYALDTSPVDKNSWMYSDEARRKGDTGFRVILIPSH